jgi:hypothetical protein
MSKSIIYTVNSTSTTVEATNIIPLGSTIRRFGGNVSQDGNSITITGKGYYHISVSATVTPEAVGNVGITTLKDGVPVTGGSVETISKVYTPPTEMMETWEKAHKKYVECVGWIKQMLAM